MGRGSWRVARYGWGVNLTAFGGLLVYAITRGAESGVDLHRGSVAAQVGDLLVFALACGVLAYATVELVKRLTGLRGSVNLSVVQTWMRDAYRFREEYSLPRRPPRTKWLEGGEHLVLARLRKFPRDPFLLLLVALGPRNLGAVFDLPPERLVAQISTAIDVALFSPKEYSPLLDVVSGFSPDESGSAVDQDGQLLGSREAQQLRLSLDELQTLLTQTWRRIVQSGAVWLAGVYGVATTFAGGLSGTNQARYLLAALILGGPIAWAIRDVTAVLGKMRQ
jgi:hypothetical protein